MCACDVLRYIGLLTFDLRGGCTKRRLGNDALSHFSIYSYDATDSGKASPVRQAACYISTKHSHFKLSVLCAVYLSMADSVSHGATL